MKNVVLILLFSGLCSTGWSATPERRTDIRIPESFTEAASNNTPDGRLLLIRSGNEEKETRFRISDGFIAKLIFVIKELGMAASELQIFDAKLLGNPNHSLTDMPPGKYFVQSLLPGWETFQLSAALTVKLQLRQCNRQELKLFN